MKRAGNLFDQTCCFENLHRAFKKAIRGSGKGEEACIFSFHLESELFTLRDEIRKGIYKPGRYRYFKVYEPKERTISVAHFRDRVVHHAVVSVMEPFFEKRFIYDSYATRKEKGTRRAVSRAQKFLKNSRYFLKFDISKYFDNIDHRVLISIISRKIKDKKLLSLIDTIIANSDLSRGLETGKGLPIGNLTSQFFANIYLDLFDHYIKDTLCVKRYIRYMDDCAVFHNDREYLKGILEMSEIFLYERLGLRLKQSATFINSRLNGLPFLGFRVFPSLIRIKRENIKRLKVRIKKKEKQYKKGELDEQRYVMGLAGLVGYAGFADSLNLRRDIFFKNRGNGQKAVPTV